MEITEDQKNFVLLQLRKYTSQSSAHMESMFESEILPFMRARKLSELEALQDTGEMNIELRNIATNFLIKDAKRRFPDANELKLLSKVKKEHVDVGAQFAGLLLSAVLQALAVEEMQEAYAESSAATLESELETLLGNESE